MLVSASYRADSHRADGLASADSADAHPPADPSPDTIVALRSYNVSIRNKEIAGKLHKAVQDTFEHDTSKTCSLAMSNSHTVGISGVPQPANKRNTT